MKAQPVGLNGIVFRLSDCAIKKSQFEFAESNLKIQLCIKVVYAIDLRHNQRMSTDQIGKDIGMLFAPAEVDLNTQSILDKDVMSDKGIIDPELKFPVGISTDVIVGTGLFYAEIQRFININSYGIQRYMESHPGWHPANIGQPWFGLLQNCGDIMPGFVASAASFWAIEGLNTVMKRKIPDNVQILLAVVMGIGAIASHELGLFAVQNYSNGNMPDILVGALGPIAYGGLHYMLGALEKDTQEKINEIELLQSVSEVRDSTNIDEAI